VASDRHDKTFAEILKKMIVGTYSYGKTIRKVLLRLPITLFKMVFGQGDSFRENRPVKHLDP